MGLHLREHRRFTLIIPSESHKAHVMDVLRGYRLTQMLHVIARLGIPDRLADGPRTAPELALSAGADPAALFRLLRALASEGVLRQDSDGNFSLTEEWQTLRSDVDGSAHSAAMLYGEPFWWSAWGGLFASVRTGGTAFEQVHGVPLFEFLGANLDAARLFNAGMQSMTAERASAIAAAIDSSGARSLVDVAGGHGALAAAIVRGSPNLAVTLFDRPSVVDGARSMLSRLGVVDRCTLVGGDFFVSVPGGADIYTLKDVLHDWDDEKALTILRNVRGAMDGPARLVVIERIVPPGGEPSVSKLIDISMLVLTGGRERTEVEYRTLLASAGFCIQRVVRVDQETSIIEGKTPAS